MFLADHKMEVERLEELRVRFENELDEQDDLIKVHMYLLSTDFFLIGRLFSVNCMFNNYFVPKKADQWVGGLSR